MLKKWHIHRLSLVVIILFTMFLVCYAAKDAAAFDGGVPISDIEMEETHGGFQMPNGNFLYFTMDFMHMEYLAHNDAGLPNADALTSILGDQSSLLNNEPGNGTFSVPGVAGVINNYVANNIGFTNVAVAMGNDITQTLCNYLNINLLTFQVTNQDQIKPVLSNYLHLVN